MTIVLPHLAKAAAVPRDALPLNIRRAVALSLPFRWNNARAYRLPPKGGPLGAYYIGWRADTTAWGEDWSVSPLDHRGVLLTLRGAFYHPIRIAQYALHSHSRWIETRSGAAFRAFVAQAQWLRDHQQERHGISGCYPFTFSWPRYGAASGWISAMAQGEAISVLLRADEMLPREGYFDAALRAAAPFQADVREGGVVWQSRDDTFFEEIAVPRAAHVLNGHIFAMFGLWELHRLTHERWVEELVAKALDTLRRRLPLYDSGYWSFYSLLAYGGKFRAVATLKYHAFHIAQLRVLAAMFGERRFDAVARRWETYQMSAASRLRVMGNTVRALGTRALRLDGIRKSTDVLA
ncbi:MAG: hypothetical protein JO193_01290 [Candidatus Eremiobacteraeota bacterium]|nr:hypothetical protein [Candidatus Eremiobacteraeota bacterium]